MQIQAVHQHCTEKSVPRTPREKSTYWHFLKYNTDAFNSNHKNKENLAIICLTAKQNAQYNSALSIMAFLSEDNSLFAH
jgi:hypothetical protein